jgi:hypothetical protein
VLTLPATSGTVITGAGGVTSVASGGTGAATLTANNVILGAGTSAVTFVAPGTNGNLLTSNGTTWTSAAAPAGGVTSLNGQTGAITDTTLYAIGSYVIGRPQDTTLYALNSTIAGSSLYAINASGFWIGSLWQTRYGSFTETFTPSLINTGTWRCVSPTGQIAGTAYSPGLWVRIS